jgi:cytochrome c-type biogenesis protein CcmH/NrfG
MAVASLVVGLLSGYLLRGSSSQAPAQPAVAIEQPSTPSGMPAATSTSTHPRPTMEQMRKMADTMAAPLLAQLKTYPNDPKLLTQLGALYSKTHRFKEAAEYYDRAAKADPKNVETRNELATSLYYSGDVDGALSQLQQALKADPKNVNALFNLGMVRWKGKNDSAGAVEAWKQLLKSNPGLDRKPIVEKMITEAQSKSTTTAAN